MCVFHNTPVTHIHWSLWPRLKHKVDGICPNWQRDTSALILRLPHKFSNSGALWGQLGSIVPSWELGPSGHQGSLLFEPVVSSLLPQSLFTSGESYWSSSGNLDTLKGRRSFGSLVKLMDPLSVIFLLMHKIKYIRLWGKLYWNPVIKILKANCNIMM